MNIEELYSRFILSPTITIDSRVCPKNSIFFALKGESFNGNKFALSALERGSVLAVVDEPKYAVDDRFFLVDDCLTALQDLARFHRKNLGLPILAITGTNGKTTTKELCAAVLKQKYNLHYTHGNLNNHIGVPLTLLGMTDKTEFAIVEMGANHPGEIKTLVNIALPDYGLITNVGKAHLEGFGSFEGVMNTKKELYDFIKDKNGKIFIDGENPYLQGMSEGIEKIIYGTNESFYVWGKIISASPFVSFVWQKGSSNQNTVSTRLIGEYNLSNLLSAVCVGSYFGVSEQAIKKGLEDYTPENNRSQLKKTEKNELILDSYNANPTSMDAALRNFNNIQTDKSKTVILGDMFELGNDAECEHQKIVDLLNKSAFQNVLLVGKNFSGVSSKFSVFQTTNELIDYLILNPVIDNCILIKGSRSMKMESVVDCL